MLMASLTDFVNEETMLQTKAKEMGVIVDRSPVCHAEFAGEGVEYAWGASKNYYRLQPLSEKRTKESWRDLVTKCLSPEVLTIDKVRSFSRRARRHILAYYTLHFGPPTDIQGEGVSLIEKLVKNSKLIEAPSTLTRHSSKQPYWERIHDT